MTQKPDNPRGLSRQTIVKIFVVYWALFAMLATLACFTVGNLMTPVGIGILAIASLVVPGVATSFHVRKGKKDRVDDIARQMP